MEAETVMLDPWLSQFPPQDRPMIRAWFGYAVSQGSRRPEVVVEMVGRLISSKLAWSVSPTSITLCEATLAALGIGGGRPCTMRPVSLHRRSCWREAREGTQRVLTSEIVSQTCGSCGTREGTACAGGKLR